MWTVYTNSKGEQWKSDKITVPGNHVTAEAALEHAEGETHAVLKEALEGGKARVDDVVGEAPNLSTRIEVKLPCARPTG